VKLQDFLAAQVRLRGGEEALVCGAKRMSFAALDEASTRLGAALADRGVAPGDRVALLLPNCAEFVIAFLGIVKAGAIAVPIGTRLAAAEVAYVLRDCAPRVAFIHAETRATFDQAAVPVRYVFAVDGHDFGPLVAIHQKRAIVLPASVEDCMICYTSGTTGNPKGAVLTHANYIVPNGYINAVEWGVSAADRHLITTPLTHRTAFGRVVNMICLGSPVVIPPKFDAQEIARLAKVERATVLGMVPTVGRMLLPVMEATPASFASLRIIVATGEAFPVQVKERILKALPQVGIHSYFAMTECGALSNLPPAEQLSRPGSIGRLVPGIEARFVDAEGRDVPAGEPGELWMRTGQPGRNITLRAYWNRPQETAESLRDGWFATGDVGRVDADGYLYIVDRKKDMVLSGGYNIYSKEVEAAIATHAAVQDVAVIGVPDETYGEAVAACVELKPGAKATPAELIEHCRSRIAGYKKPKHVRFVAELPRNSTGKVQKFRLRETFTEEVA
jgi:long-chain acyl-CoA synthetase